MKCANCDSAALYVYDPPRVLPTAYCAAHLPKFLRAAAKSGALTTTERFSEVQASALSALAVPAVVVAEAPPRKKKAPRVSAAEVLAAEPDESSDPAPEPDEQS